MNLADLHERIGRGSDEELLPAVRLLNREVASAAEARAFLRDLLLMCLEANRYDWAAALLWGRSLFDPRSREVTRIWEAIQNNSCVGILGAASLGKTFGVIVWLLLDWARDPGFTSVKILSATSGHARSNPFTTLGRLYRQSALKLPGIQQTEFIGLSSDDRLAAIVIVAIPVGDDGKARLSGYHPQPRPYPHWAFGTRTRIRAFLDECESIPPGCFEGIDNMASVMTGTEQIKIIAATNPKDPLSKFGQYTMPRGGWGIDLDQDFEWVSKMDWATIRLDALYSANVRTGLNVFEGMQTRRGFEILRHKGGGETLEFYSFGRGAYPPEGAVDSIIPQILVDESLGRFIFKSGSIACAGVDLAMEIDQVKMAIGRYGQAIAFEPFRGEPINFDAPRWCVQIERVFSLAKALSMKQAAQIRAKCEEFEVDGAWLTLDRTGLGTGVTDILRESWNRDVRGINWGEQATGERIVEEEETLPIEECEGVSTEMYVAFRKLLEYGYVAISPVLAGDHLIEEITQRRYRITGRGPSGLARIRLEKKEDFRARIDRSPDAADAVVMLLHGVRFNAKERAKIALQQRVRRQPPPKSDRRFDPKWVNFAQDPTAGNF